MARLYHHSNDCREIRKKVDIPFIIPHAGSVIRSGFCYWISIMFWLQTFQKKKKRCYWQRLSCVPYFVTIGYHCLIPRPAIPGFSQEWPGNGAKASVYILCSYALACLSIL